MAKSKKWIQAKKIEAFKAKNLGQSRIFFDFEPRQAITKWRQAFVKALIWNHFDVEYYIYIKTKAFGYTISRNFK